jgi:Tol biopolymer transport system component
LSRDGNRLLYWSGANPSTLYGYDRAVGSNFVITNAYPPGQPGFAFSSDGRFVTYLAKSSSSNAAQIFGYDFDAQASTLVSRDLNASGVVNSNCDSPAISSDGRLIVYRSSATDISPASTNGIPQLFLFDRLGGTTTLLTMNRFGTAPADNRPFSPSFSGDGQAVLFGTWASDSWAQDFNYNSDLFVCPLLYPVIAAGTASQGPTLN